VTDLSITAANVKRGSNAIVDRSRDAGATVTAGQPVYLDPATGTYKLADANGSGTRACDGIALNGASAGQPLAVHKGGDLTAGATLSPGATYCVSATAGGICPQADLSTGDDVIVIGVATSASNLAVRPFDTGVTL
jgi:hypothetical protein